MKVDRIISGDEYDRLQTFRKLWWTGWVFAVVLAIVTIFQSARASVAECVMKRVEATEQSLRDLQTDQARAIDRISQVTEHQVTLGAEIEAASNVIKAHQIQVDTNRGLTNRNRADTLAQ